MAKIGSPLFILQEQCAKDLMAVIERLAEIGFDGIEFLGFFGHSPADIRRKLDSCGIAAIGDHVPFERFVSETGKVISERGEIGCSFITVAPPPPEGMPGGTDYPRTIEAFIKIGEAVNAAGMRLLFHNHAEELCGTADGKTVLEHLMDDIPPAILGLEPDFGWMGIGGADPAYYLRKYGSRSPVLHFKDYIPSDNEQGFLFRPTGYGVIDNAGLYAMSLAASKPEWYVMDHDHAYGRDIFRDLEISLDYFRNLEIISNN
ncbi:MAG: sugar phosphate isomerase/epimerase [Oscillospiraceae bacterium]|nr:sugar phosphate isomerase/epimerase [Oscillospiraceae bacterium]